MFKVSFRMKFHFQFLIYILIVNICMMSSNAFKMYNSEQFFAWSFHFHIPFIVLLYIFLQIWNENSLCSFWQ